MAWGNGALRSLRALATLDMAQAVADVASAVQARRQSQVELDVTEGRRASVLGELRRPVGELLHDPMRQVVLRRMLRAESALHAQATGRLEEAAELEQARREVLTAARYRERTLERAVSTSQDRERADRDRCAMREADDLWLRRAPWPKP